MKKYILPLIVLGALMVMGSQAQAGLSVTFVSGGGYQNCYQPRPVYNRCAPPVYYSRGYGRPCRPYYAPQPVYYQPQVIYYSYPYRVQKGCSSNRGYRW